MMKEDKVEVTATIRLTVPRAVLVIVDFDGDIRNAIEETDTPHDYDLEPNECFVRYVLDESAATITRPMTPIGLGTPIMPSKP